MNKIDLIKLCRYYDGHNKTFKDSQHQSIANLEYQWVERTFKSISFADIIDEYLSYGLRTFCEYDDTPITLKEYLCNRFMHHTERVDIDAFKEFYKNYVSQGR